MTSQLFSNMFHSIKRMDDYSQVLSSSPENKGFDGVLFYLIMLEEDTIRLIRMLKENIPFPYYLNEDEDVSKIHQKTPLLELHKRVKDLRNRLHIDSQISAFISTDQLEQIEVWDYKCTPTDLFPGANPWTYSYWGGVFGLLGWNHLSVIQLKTCELFVHSEKVNIKFEWEGPYKHTTSLTIPNVAYRFWHPVLNVHKPAHPSLQTMMYFLYLQTEIAWGENVLYPIGVEDGRLTASLQIPRADHQMSHPSELPLSETSRKDVSDYIVRQFYPHYLALSQQVEEKLHHEQKHRQRYVEKGQLESDALDQIPIWLNELTKLREAYTEEVTRLE